MWPKNKLASLQANKQKPTGPIFKLSKFEWLCVKEQIQPVNKIK